MKKLIALVILCVFAMCLGGCGSESASAGIIGGADGPTAIFVTSNINWLYVCGFVSIIVVAIWVALIIYRNRNKK